MAHDIFICHAPEDRSIANDVAVNLEEAGFTCWIAPRDVQTGADYAQAIVSGISNAAALLLVYSEHSNTSPHVGREVERAVSRNTDIIAFRLSNAEPSPSLEYFISRARWVDATGGSPQEHVPALTAAFRLRVSGERESDVRRGARETLRRIVDDYGPELADDPRRVKALLGDLAGGHPSEVAALVAAAEEGVGAALLQAPQGLAPEAAQRLARRLHDNRSLTEGTSDWAVESWLYALGMEALGSTGPTAPAAGQLGETVAPGSAAQPGSPPAMEAPLEPTVAAADRYAITETQPQPDAVRGPAVTRAAPTPQPHVPFDRAPPTSGSARSSFSWLFPTGAAAVALTAVVGGVILFGGGDGGGPTATRGPSETTARQQTTVSEAAFFSLEGLTVSEVVNRYPVEAAAIGLPVGCAALVDLIPTDVETGRLRTGEMFVWGSFQAPFCDTEIWGIADAGGTLRELTVQVSEPTSESVRQMTDMALALVGTVGFPEATGQFAISSLDEFGWLSAPDPTRHQGDAVVGSIQLGTFLHEGGFTFYMVPAS